MNYCSCMYNCKFRFCDVQYTCINKICSTITTNVVPLTIWCFINNTEQHLNKMFYRHNLLSVLTICRWKKKKSFTNTAFLYIASIIFCTTYLFLLLILSLQRKNIPVYLTISNLLGGEGLWAQSKKNEISSSCTCICKYYGLYENVNIRRA